MVRDRDTALTLRAAANGSIDYSRANPLDPRWLAYWRTMAEMTHAQLAEESLRLRYAFHVSLLSSPLHNQNTFAATQERATDLLELFKQIQMPWLPTREATNEEEERNLKEVWQQKMGFGIEDEEAVAAWSRKVENTLSAQVQTAEDAARAEMLKTAEIRQRAEELRAKRHKQRSRG